MGRTGRWPKIELNWPAKRLWQTRCGNFGSRFITGIITIIRSGGRFQGCARNSNPGPPGGVDVELDGWLSSGHQYIMQ